MHKKALLIADKSVSKDDDDDRARYFLKLLSEMNPPLYVLAGVWCLVYGVRVRRSVTSSEPSWCQGCWTTDMM